MAISYKDRERKDFGESTARVLQGSTGNVAGGKVFLVCCVIALIVGQVWLFHSMLPTALAEEVDFVAFYRAGVMVRDGQAHELYQVERQQEANTGAFGKRLGVTRYFYHPAYETLLFAPLAHVSYRTAFWMWTIAGAIFLTAGALALGLNPFVALAFFPVVLTLVQGQDSLLLFAILAFAFRQFRAGKDTSAGVILGLGLIKFQFTLPLVAILVLRRRWKLVRGFVVMAVLVAGVSLLIVGPQGALQYMQILHRHGMHKDQLMPNLHGLVEYSGGGFLTTLLLSVLVVAWSGFRRLSTKEQEFSVASIAAILVSFHGYVADLPLLLIPMSAEFRSGRWPSLLFFATPLYLLLFNLRMWPLIALGLVGFLASISLGVPAVTTREALR